MNRPVLLLAVAVTAAQSLHADEFDGIRQRILRHVEEEGVPSISIAVVRGREVVWEESVGWADRENRVRATPHTPYMLASLSKPITATAAAVAHERGQLDLDRPVNTYLREIQVRTTLGPAERITLRDLILHRSGLPNYMDMYHVDGPRKPPTMDTLILLYGATMVPYGEFHYSNLGYPLLAHVLSRATGKSFSEYVREEVFEPLGMKDSFVPTGSRLKRHRAIRYQKDGTRLPEFATTSVAAAEIYASAHDLARFALFHMNRRLPDQKAVLPEKTVETMQQGTMEILGFSYRYGSGWSVGVDTKGRRQVFHGGGFHGVDTHFTMIFPEGATAEETPGEPVAVGVLSNINRRWPGVAVSEDIVERVLAILLDDTVANVELEYSFDESQEEELPEVFSGRWEGAVHTRERDLPVALWFQEDGDIHAKLGDQLKTLVNEPKYFRGTLWGSMMGNIGTEEVRHPESDELQWNVRLLDGKLRGVLYVNYPGKEANGYYFPYWVELEKKEAGE